MHFFREINFKLTRLETWIGILLVSQIGVIFPDRPCLAQDKGEFRDVEIRVIRPKFFNKRKRFELGGQGAVIMNETFIYTLMASGIATYHLSESWALGAYGSIGFSIDKEDKGILFDEFLIKTKIFRTFYNLGADVQWTPVYGKWQTAEGKLIYFDTYLSAGAGMTGIQWRYSDFCNKPDDTKYIGRQDEMPAAVPGDKVMAYPTLVFGIGQRYFVSKTRSYNVSLKDHFIMYNVKDEQCDPAGGATGSGTHNNITLQIGTTKFF